VGFFHDEGYLIIPDIFKPEELEPLRQDRHQEINRKAQEFQKSDLLHDLHEALGLDHQVSAIYRDAKECGSALVKHLIGDRGGSFLSPVLFSLIIYMRC
jgi:hypothetical protein